MLSIHLHNHLYSVAACGPQQGQHEGYCTSCHMGTHTELYQHTPCLANLAQQQPEETVDQLPAACAQSWSPRQRRLSGGVICFCRRLGNLE